MTKSRLQNHTIQHVNISTFQHLIVVSHISTFQHFNIWRPPPGNSSPFSHYNILTFQHLTDPVHISRLPPRPKVHDSQKKKLRPCSFALLVLFVCFAYLFIEMEKNQCISHRLFVLFVCLRNKKDWFHVVCLFDCFVCLCLVLFVCLVCLFCLFV